jgi:hypothetical protein
VRGRQIIGPRRVVLAAILDDGSVVLDSAIDLKHSQLWTEYWPSLFDPAKLQFHPGDRPSWFTISPVSTAQKLAAPPRGSNAPAFPRAAFFVRAGLLSIEDYPIVAADGSERPAAQPERRRMGGLGEMATDDWLADSGLSEHDICALGIMIEHISEALHPLARRSVGPSGPGGQREQTESS